MPATRAPPAAPALDGAVPFRGAHQAGIVTPAQDRLHFVALDVVDRRTAPQLVDLLKAVDRGRRADDRRRRGGAGRRRRRRPLRRARRTPARRSACRASGLTITIGFGPSLFDDRFGLADRRPGGAARTCPAFRGDDLDPARSGGDLVHPGLRQRPAGRGARRAQPRADRLRRRRGAVVAARLRPHVVDPHDPGDAAQPVRLQGRHQQPQGRGRRRARRARLGRARRTCPGAAPGWPAAPTSSPAGSGCTSRSGTAPRCRSRRTIIGRDKGEGAPLGQADGVRRARLRDEGRRRPARDPGRRARPARARRATSTASGSCAAATTSPTAPTASATSTPGCSSSPSCATRAGSSCRCSARWPPSDALNEYIEHTGSAVFACPPGVRPGEYWGRPSSPERGRPYLTTASARRCTRSLCRARWRYHW